MKPIPIGVTGSFSLVVTPEHTANRFKDALLPPVLATPVMVLIMENAALNAIKPYLEDNETALGTRVDVRHLAATPIGFTATAEAEVVEVEGRKILFRVVARDGIDTIGEAVHERMVIQRDRLEERLAAKASRMP